jgi:hypothetical protein
VEEVWRESDPDLFAFRSPHEGNVFAWNGERIPLLENWFLAAVPKTRFISQWKDEFVKALTYVSMGRLETWFTEFAAASASTEDGRTSYQNIDPGVREYLLMHCCQQKVLQTQRLSLDDWGIASKLSGEGPFKNHLSFHWDVKAMVRAMASPYNEEPPISRRSQTLFVRPRYFVKIRGVERKHLERLWETFQDATAESFVKQIFSL